MDEEKEKALKNLKADLLGIVMSNPNQMNMNSLIRDYRETIGGSIPIHKYGHSKTLIFLQKECTDIFMFSSDPYNPILTPIVSDDVKHVNELIDKQRKSKCKRYPLSTPHRMSYPVRRSNPMSSSYSGGKSYSTWGGSQQRSNSSYPNGNNYKSNTTGNGYNKSPSPSFNSGSNNHNYNSSRSKPSDNYSKPIPSTKSSNWSSNETNPKPLMETTVKKPDTPVMTKEETNKKTVEDNAQEALKKSELEEYPKNHRIGDKLVKNLKEMMEAYPNGLWCRELSHAYKKKYLVDFNCVRMGYNTVITMCKDLPMVFKITRPGKTGDWRLFPNNAVIPPQYRDGADDVEQKKEEEEANKKFSVDELIFGSIALPGVQFDASLYPDDCAKYGESVHDPVLPTQKIFLLQISEARDPSHFWFQVIAKSASVVLDTIMDEMSEFYYNNPLSRNYVMVRAAAKTGQLCAAPYGEGGRYHRAIVIKNVSMEIVKVFYLDYGTVGDIEFSKIRMLLNEYCDVAVQAHRGRLAGVAPVGFMWSAKAKERFMDLIMDKQLQGQVLAQTHDANCIVSLKLIDHYEEIDVGGLLVSEGLAIVDERNSLVKSFYLSFDDLEEGIDVESTHVEEESTCEPTYVEIEEHSEEEIFSEVSCEPEDKKLFLEDVKKESNLLPINLNNPLNDLDICNSIDSNDNTLNIKELQCVNDEVKDKGQIERDELYAKIAEITQNNHNMYGHLRSNSLDDGLEYCKKQVMFNQQQFNQQQQFQQQQQQMYLFQQQQQYNKQFLNPYAPSFQPQYSYSPMGPVPPQMPNTYQPMQQIPMPQFNVANNNNPNIYNNPHPSMGYNPQYDNRNFWQPTNNFPHPPGPTNVPLPPGPNNFPFAVRPMSGPLHNFQPKLDANSIIRLKRPITQQSFSGKPLVYNTNNVFDLEKITKEIDMHKSAEEMKKKANIELFKDINKTECKLVNKSLDNIDTSNGKQNKSISSGDDLELLSSDEGEDDDIKTDNLPVDECVILTLVAVTKAFEENLEIWSMNDKPHVILQQAAKTYLKTADVDTVSKKYNPIVNSDNNLPCILLQDSDSVVGNILREIKKTGSSGVKEEGLVKFVNKKEIEITQSYITLIPIGRLCDVFCSDTENIKHDIVDLMNSTETLYRKYGPSASDPDCSDSDNEDSYSN